MSDRARILVDPKVQWTIVGRVLLHWVLFLVCITSISAMVRVMSSVGQHDPANSVRAAIMAQIPIVGVMLMLLPVFLRDTLRLSNRFAGPMYRLRMALAEIRTTGTTIPIKFRTGDFWQETATEFNAVLADLDELRRENELLRRQLADSAQLSEV